MPSTRQVRAKNEKYHENITKRGKVEVAKRDSQMPVGPVVLGFFLFVVVGSALLQIIRGF